MIQKHRYNSFRGCWHIRKFLKFSFSSVLIAISFVAAMHYAQFLTVEVLFSLLIKMLKFLTVESIVWFPL